MRLGKRLRGIVSAVAAVALALAMAPASARAVTLTNGTATVTGVSGATTVELYKVADIADTNDDNVLEVSPLYSFTVADYEQNPAAVANAIASQVTGDPDYTAAPSGDAATFTDVEPACTSCACCPRRRGASPSRRGATW